MGLRYRKSIKICKGVRLNLSKSGVGYSIGGKGFRYTKKANGGTRTTYSIPGTGVSYVTESGKKKAVKKEKREVTPPSSKATAIILYVCAPILLLCSLLFLLITPVVGVLGVAASIGFFALGRYYGKKAKAEKVEKTESKNEKSLDTTQ